MHWRVFCTLPLKNSKFSEAELSQVKELTVPTTVTPAPLLDEPAEVIVPNPNTPVVSGGKVAGDGVVGGAVTGDGVTGGVVAEGGGAATMLPFSSVRVILTFM